MQPGASQHGDGDHRLYRFDESGEDSSQTSNEHSTASNASSNDSMPTHPLSEQEWRRLSQVASHCQNSAATFEEFVVALVREFLLNRFPTKSLQQNVLEQMSLRIGQTLCGDPFSKQRLMDLRQNLRGSHHEC